MYKSVVVQSCDMETRNLQCTHTHSEYIYEQESIGDKQLNFWNEKYLRFHRFWTEWIKLYQRYSYTVLKSQTYNLTLNKQMNKLGRVRGGNKTKDTMKACF